jgi:hypothetical protein
MKLNNTGTYEPDRSMHIKSNIVVHMQGIHLVHMNEHHTVYVAKNNRQAHPEAWSDVVRYSGTLFVCNVAANERQLLRFFAPDGCVSGGSTEACSIDSLDTPPSVEERRPPARPSPPYSPPVPPKSPPPPSARAHPSTGSEAGGFVLPYKE